MTDAEAISRVEGHSADLARMGRFAILVVALDRVVALARAQAAAQEAPRASEMTDPTAALAEVPNPTDRLAQALRLIMSVLCEMGGDAYSAFHSANDALAEYDAQRSEPGAILGDVAPSAAPGSDEASGQPDLAKLRELLAEATPLPWSLSPEESVGLIEVLGPDDMDADDEGRAVYCPPEVVCVESDGPRNVENLTVVVAAVNALPWLLAQAQAVSGHPTPAQVETVKRAIVDAYEGALQEEKWEPANNIDPWECAAFAAIAALRASE